MTNPESTGSARPARAAGYALLAVAAASLVIGVISLFTGGEDTTGAQSGQPPASATGAPTTGSEGATPSSDAPSATTPSSDAPSATTSSAPGATTGTTTAAPPADPPPPPVTPQNRPDVRVYNNSTIPNLAARASSEVRALGWQVTDTSNYSQGQIPTTTVYYRPGTEEEGSAKQLAELLRARVEPRFEGIVGAHAGIIVIVTNDYRGTGAKSGS